MYEHAVLKYVFSLVYRILLNATVNSDGNGVLL